MNKINRLERLTEQLIETYKAKNKDYGDSFADSFREFGITSAVVRMNDKMNRIKSLSKGEDRQVKDESLIDSLMDLANYALMTVIELENEHDWVNDRFSSLKEDKKYYLRAMLSGIDEDENYLNLDKHGSGFTLNNNEDTIGYQTELTKDEIANLIINWDVDLDDFDIEEVESDYEAGRQENL